MANAVSLTALRVPCRVEEVSPCLKSRWNRGEQEDLVCYASNKIPLTNACHPDVKRDHFEPQYRRLNELILPSSG